MPSIEIVCVEQEEVSELPEYSFAVAAESVLRSHRIPSPLWQSEFERMSGCMYHLGHPGLKKVPRRGFFFAYDLLSERAKDSESLLEFDANHRGDLAALFRRLVTDSPARSIVVTSDWQFGPESTTRGEFDSLEGFWRDHDAQRLRMNSFYRVNHPGSA